MSKAISLLEIEILPLVPKIDDDIVDEGKNKICWYLPENRKKVFCTENQVMNANKI